MKVLITGGAGFIGGNFARLLMTKTQSEIVILDALTYAGNLRSIEDVLASSRAQFVRGDIRDFAQVKAAFDQFKPTHVIHFAAESHVDRSILGPKAFIETNIMGTFNLLEVLRERGQTPHAPRFLHVSTDEVFGDLEGDIPPANELARYLPSSPYAASKAGADHLAQAWQHTYQLPILISNCSNNYGPWQFPEKLIPLMILNAIEGKPLPIYGDGKQIRDWIHVEDHCAALLEILFHGRVGETYNIGATNERANYEVIDLICDSVDLVLDRKQGTARLLKTQVTDRPGHDRRYALDSSKVMRELHWRPQKNFEEEMAKLVRWYREHKTWADEIRSGDYRKFYEQQYGPK